MSFLSHKTLTKSTASKKQRCPNCRRLLKRLDTHLRLSASCKHASAPLGFEPVRSSCDNRRVVSNISTAEHHPVRVSEDLPVSDHVTYQDTTEPSLPVSPSSVLLPPSISHGHSAYTPISSTAPSMLKPLKCPKSDEEWQEADTHMCAVVVPAVLSAQTIEDKNFALCSGIYSYFANRHGVRRSPQRTNKRKERRSRKENSHKEQIRSERNKLRNNLRRARRNGQSQEVIKEIARNFHQLLRQFSSANKAEQCGERRRRALGQSRKCARNFSGFVREVLDSDGIGCVSEPSFDAASAQDFFKNIYTSEEKVFTRPAWLPEAPSPDHPFNEGPLTHEELSRVVKKVKTRSSPCPLDQVPYSVFRHCPSLLQALLCLFNLCWEQGSVPRSWKEGVVRLIAKPAAEADPHNPANFRPIALTSCVGKIYTSILKNRWLGFMVSNGYLDTSTQKAFLPGVPGCVEHYRKLMAMVEDAHQKHRSLAVCWLDLANAYGSVHHRLISFCLRHFYAPPSFLQSVSSLYSNLTAIISTEEWCTAPIPFRIGVYQGDPLSPIIFTTVMATLTDSLKSLADCGYTLSGSSVTTNILLYADDVCLMSDGPAGGQRLLSQVDRWLNWTGMIAKIPKCHSLALKASTAKKYDPGFVLQGKLIPFVGCSPVRFLGGTVTIPVNHQAQRRALEEKLTTLLMRVDRSAVTKKQKLLLYRAGVCPRLVWDLSVSDFPVSWVKSVLEAATTKFLKRWSGLALSADTAQLYLPKQEGGLGLPSPSIIYRKMKVSQGALMLTSHDKSIRVIASRTIRREESWVRSLFRPVSYCRDVMKSDPGMNRKTLAKRARAAVAVDDATTRREHSESLPSQGALMRVDSYAPNIWASVVSSLEFECMKFALNAATDTLPHNCNLAKWRKGLVSEKCRLCGGRQTLHHVLNHCEEALQLRRYNKRHDKVLEVMSEMARTHLPEHYQLVVDLDNNDYCFPSHIVPTSLRPDMVIWSDSKRQLHAIELTVCFETGFRDAAARKTARYAELASEVRRAGYKCSVVPVQVGSRGVLEEVSITSFRNTLNRVPDKKWKAFLNLLVSTTIKESHSIWCSRNIKN